MQLDFIWTLVGFFLTLLVFSYLLGDNPLFRFASYLFVGVSAGYIGAILLYQVLIPKLLWPFLIGDTTEKVLAGAALLLTLLLLARLIPALGPVSSIPMAYLVGSGAAVIIGGVVLGTIFAQTRATAAGFSLTAGTPPAAVGMQLLDALFMLAGTIATLAFFHFGAKARPNETTPTRSPLINRLAGIGQVFIGLTLGALFAGVLAASLTALIDRLNFLWNVVFNQIL
ncbi:MAG TPA: hypothetical protein VFF68_08055 [Anaerolineaceae bacterium]|nr:hypothetical protein [Anaerolineaceae bacterium]